MHIFLFCLFSFFSDHPYHVSNTTISYSAKDKEIQIVSAYFAEDFDLGLKKNFGTQALNLYEPKDSILLNEQIKKYLLTYNQVSIDDSLCQLEFLGYEIKNNQVYCYLFISNVSTIPQKSILVHTDILYDIRKHQSHILNLSLPTGELRARISNPVTDYVFDLRKK